MEGLAFQFLCPPPLTRSECAHYDSWIRSTVTKLASIPPASYDKEWQVLEKAQPGPQTLYYAAAITAILEKYQYTPDHERVAALYPKVLEFLRSYDPVQARYVGNSWRNIVKFALSYADQMKEQDAPSFIQPVQDAILRLDPTGSVLTSSHLLFVEQCLKHRTFSLALPVLDKDIYHIPSSIEDKFATTAIEEPCDPQAAPSSYITIGSGLTEELDGHRILEYFLYGAMIYMGLSNWQRALHFLEIVIRAPTRSCVSKVQLEAYKKWILVNLIEYGTVTQIAPPEFADTAASSLNLFATPYITVAEAFKGSDYSVLLKEVEHSRSVWNHDSNGNLMNHVLFAYRKHAVINLGRIFKAIPISDITSYLPFEEPQMERFLEYLVQHGHVQASLSSSDSSSGARILRFTSDLKETSGPPTSAAESEFKSLLDRKTAEMNMLGSHIKEVEDKLRLSVVYARKQNI